MKVQIETNMNLSRTKVVMFKKLKLGANWVTSIVHEQNRNFRAVCFTHCF